MIRRRVFKGWSPILWGICLLLLAGCQATRADELNGRITLWHDWSPAEAVVLNEALTQFQENHPHVRISTVALPAGQILNKFEESGNDGLGPDILIGADAWIGELAEAGLLRALSLEELPLAFFNSRNRALTQYHGEVYGVPFFLAPQALYYNENLVTELPDTLDALLQEAANGNRVAFAPRFEKAYWGIQAFGEGLFDASGKFTLAESGFTEWLDWLDEAQRAPGVILNEDDESLLALFATEQVAYYIAGPEKQALIADMIEERNSLDYGVVPLPGGPEGSAGPLLPAETILLYAHSSPAQIRTANALAVFLINQQQSIRFLRELGHVPANSNVRVDRRIYPIVSGFSQQARTSEVIPNEILTDSLNTAGDRAYVSVLSGVLTPAEAVCRFGQEVAAFQGYTAAEMSLPVGCEVAIE